jgi:hypothetical protein
VPTVADLDALDDLEARPGKRVYNVLQLRHHDAIRTLKAEVDADPRATPFDVEFTYITSRGRWYHESWKGDPRRSPRARHQHRHPLLRHAALRLRRPRRERAAPEHPDRPPATCATSAPTCAGSSAIDAARPPARTSGQEADVPLDHRRTAASSSSARASRTCTRPPTARSCTDAATASRTPAPASSRVTSRCPGTTAAASQRRRTGPPLPGNARRRRDDRPVGLCPSVPYVDDGATVGRHEDLALQPRDAEGRDRRLQPRAERLRRQPRHHRRPRQDPEQRQRSTKASSSRTTSSAARQHGLHERQDAPQRVPAQHQRRLRTTRVEARRQHRRQRHRRLRRDAARGRLRRRRRRRHEGRARVRHRRRRPRARRRLDERAATVSTSPAPTRSPTATATPTARVSGPTDRGAIA